MGVKKITELTQAQRDQMDPWADKWIEIGLRTGEADRPTFESGARRCYSFAGLAEPRAIVWCPSPIVAVTAGPSAHYVLDRPSLCQDVLRAKDSSIWDGIVHVSVDAVHEAVKLAIAGCGYAPASGGKTDTIQGHARELKKAISSEWHMYIGGQFWVGGWGYSSAWSSFFREVCDLELEGDLWDRAIAYEDTVKSACWWWPADQFIMVSERPLVIHRELTDPNVPRGWSSHRLHCPDGPSISWPDGWGVWYWHGVRVPRHVIEHPEAITAKEITDETNAEVRRVMLERYGHDRYIADLGAKPVHQDDWGTLYRVDLNDDEPLTMVHVINSSPEPDGSFKNYWLRVHHQLRPVRNGEIVGPPQKDTALNAIASTWGLTGDQYTGMAVQT